MDQNKIVACTILHQLGGQRFIAMTGAKNFGSKPNGCCFMIGQNAAGINVIDIELNVMDTYDIKFKRMRGTELKTIAEANNIYNDNLQEVFTSYTGMNTKLF